MNISMSERAVISLEEAVIIGSMKGVVINKGHIAAIYFSIKEDDGLSLSVDNKACRRYMQVPAGEVQFGPDAFMLKKVLSASVFLCSEQVIHVGMNAFDCSGKLLGKITCICVDEEYAIKGIYAESEYIHMDRVLNIGDVVLVLGNGDAEEEGSGEKSETIPEEAPADNEVSSIAFDSQELFHDMAKEHDSENVESKYQYLLHKSLLNDITIANKKYLKGSRVDVELINAAIKYNCLLNLIMNAED